MSAAGNRLRELLLWVGAALGLLAVAAAVAVTFLGFNFLVFRSGSMEPEISTGGLALSRTTQAEDIDAGDVVSVVAANGDRITHRVVSTTLRGEEASLVLQGDANVSPDSEIYVVESAERVVASVPLGGYVVAHALTPPGMVAVACFSLMLLVVAFARDDEDDEDDGDDSDDGAESGDDEGPRATAADDDPTTPVRRSASVLLAAAAVTAVASVSAHTTGTWAAFTDRATATSGELRAADLPAPGAPGSTQTQPASTVELSWQAVSAGGAPASSYEVVRYLAATGGTPETVCTTTALTCTDARQNGTVYYAVRARLGSWVEESPRTTYSPDVTGPTLGLTQPTTTGGTANTLRTQVASCAPTGIACGTASDPGGVTSTEYALRRQVTSSGTTTTACWNGSQWVSQATATCTTFRSAGTTTWSVPGSSQTAYPNRTAATFTLSLRSTDGFGNVGTGTVTYAVTG